MSFAPFNNPWRKAPVVPYSSSDSGITLLPAPSHPPCGKHWFMLVSSSLTAARPFPAFTRFSYIAPVVTRYSVLPHKALPMKNIVNNSGHCHPMSCPSPCHPGLRSGRASPFHEILLSRFPLRKDHARNNGNGTRDCDRRDALPKSNHRRNNRHQRNRIDIIARQNRSELF